MEVNQNFESPLKKESPPCEVHLPIIPSVSTSSLTNSEALDHTKPEASPRKRNQLDSFLSLSLSVDKSIGSVFSTLSGVTSELGECPEALNRSSLEVTETPTEQQQLQEQTVLGKELVLPIPSTSSPNLSNRIPSSEKDTVEESLDFPNAEGQSSGLSVSTKESTAAGTVEGETGGVTTIPNEG